MNIIDNLMAARRILSTAPAETINLESYGKRQPACRTLYCALGWLAVSEQFPGVKLEWYGLYQFMQFAHIVNAAGEVISDSELDAVFGPSSYPRLFNVRGKGLLDRAIMKDRRDMTDLELALRRIDQQILAIREAELQKEAA